MKLILVLFLSAVLVAALAEPLRYRQAGPIRTSARQTDGGVALRAELGDSTTEASDNQSDEGTPEPPSRVPQVPFNQNAPYYPQGWRPLGQLLVLPFGIRENLESTRTVESSTFNEAENTEAENTEAPATESDATKGQLQLETSEPKLKKTTPYKRPTVKLVGELKLGSKENSKENSKEDSTESNQTGNTTTETDEITTAQSKSADLETTSEPEAEAVDAENSNGEGQQSTNTQEVNQSQAPGATQAPQGPQYFIQLPDGSLQRIVYLTSQTPAQAAIAPQQANVPQFQQVRESPNYPFAFNPITNPRIVTYSTQYHAF